MCEESIQISKLNLNLENKFDDEYFIFSNGIDNFYSKIKYIFQIMVKFTTKLKIDY